MSVKSTKKPALGDLIRAWICGWTISESRGPDTPRSGDDNQSTLKLIYDELRLALEEQKALRTSLQTTASFLVGFTGTILALVISAKDLWLAAPYTTRVLVLLSIILSVVAVLLSGLSLWFRGIRTDPNPVGLAEGYINVPIEDARLQIIANRKDAWQKNHAIIRRNTGRLKAAFLVQSIATVSLAIALFIAVS